MKNSSEFQPEKYEEQFDIKPVGVRLKCPYCDNGYMEYTGEHEKFKYKHTGDPKDPDYYSLAEPIKYIHECKICHEKVSVEKQYPSVIWVDPNAMEIV